MSILPKTIVLDVDGTLTLPKQMEPTANVKNALKREIEHGNEVVIATGRPLYSAIPIGQTIGCTPITLLTSNGNLTLSYPSRKILSYHTLSRECCLPIIESLVREGICGYIVLADRHEIESGGVDYNVRVADYLRVVCEQEGRTVEIPDVNSAFFQNSEEYFRPASFEKVREMVQYDILNVHLHPSSVERTDKYIAELKRFETDEIVIKKSGDTIIEIFNPAINKGVILEELAYTGLVVYMGDSENDIPGIEWAVRKNGYGVAMGNAFDSVKAKANYVTTSVYDDGIVWALDHINSLEE